jgi:hypothetical protein
LPNHLENGNAWFELRSGLKDGCERTLEEVGRQLNVTRERVRQIEAKALKKLRHPIRIKQLEGFGAAEDLAAGAQGAELEIQETQTTLLA